MAGRSLQRSAAAAAPECRINPAGTCPLRTFERQTYVCNKGGTASISSLARSRETGFFYANCEEEMNDETIDICTGQTNVSRFL